MLIEQLQRRVHALAEEARQLARGGLDVDGVDVSDRRLVLSYIDDARAELSALEQRLGLGRRPGRFVALEPERKRA